MNEQNTTDYHRTYIAKMLVDRKLEPKVFEAAWHNTDVAEHIVSHDLKLIGAMALLKENLNAWLGEEDSVKSEHHRLINATRKAVFDAMPLEDKEVAR